MPVDLVRIHRCRCESCSHRFRWYPGGPLCCPQCLSPSVLVLGTRTVPVVRELQQV